MSAWRRSWPGIFPRLPMDSLPVPPALGALVDDHLAVRRNSAYAVHGAAGPSYRNPVHARGGAKAEVQAEVALREVTASAPHFVDLPQAAGFQLHARADAIAIRFGPDELDADPVVGRGRIRHQQRRVLVQLVHDDRDATVVI